MTFFYNLNKTLDAIRAKPETTHGQLNERANSKPVKEGGLGAAVGAGLGALAAGPVGAAAGGALGHYSERGLEADDADQVKRAQEGFGDMARKVGGSVKKMAGQALDTLGHGNDEEMIRDLQRKAGVPVTGKVPPQQPGTGQQPNGVKEQSAPATPVTLKDPVAAANYNAFNQQRRNDSAAMIAKIKEQSAPVTLKDPVAAANYDAFKQQRRSDSAAMIAKIKEDDMEEGNKFTGNLMKARAAGKTHADLDGDGDMEKVREAKKSKPDFLDLDGDGNRKEPMKSATRKVAGKRYGGAAQKDDEPEVKSEVPRGRGRPKKSTDTEQGADLKPDWSAFGIGKVKLPAHKGAVTKHKLSDKEPGKKKAMTREEIDEAIAALEGCGYSVTPLEEKAVSKKQQKFMGMVHAAQKGQKPASKAVAAVAKEMPKKAAKDFAATKHKGLPEKAKKTKEVDETTVAGSVAPAAGSKSKQGGIVGKGIYDSLNREVEAMISESMNISVNMSMDEHGEPRKNITVSAEGEAAEQLAQLLNLAGMASHNSGHEDCGCGTSPCSCEELDENQPDWPTNQETTGKDDPLMRRWSMGGLNGSKSTGQSVGAPFNRQDSRQGVMSENNDLGLSLFQEYTKYKAK